MVAVFSVFTILMHGVIMKVSNGLDLLWNVVPNWLRGNLPGSFLLLSSPVIL